MHCDDAQVRSQDDPLGRITQRCGAQGFPLILRQWIVCCSEGGLESRSSLPNLRTGAGADPTLGRKSLPLCLTGLEVRVYQRCRQYIETNP
jgi:hypothetical protein